MKQKVFFIIIGLLSSLYVYADEGLWLPSLNTSVYQKISPFLELTEKDIYDEEHASIKDAIVLFGGGCTGVVISNDGLVLTNHHCGYKYIRQLSTEEDDYSEKGFYAVRQVDELHNENLSVRFLVKTIDVTDEMSLPDTVMSENMRSEHIQKSIEKLTDLYKKNTRTIQLSSVLYIVAINLCCIYMKSLKMSV